MRHLKRQLLSASSAVRGFPETQHGTSKNMLLSNSQIMLQDLTGFFVPHIFVFSFRNVFFGTGGGQVAKRC